MSKPAGLLYRWLTESLGGGDKALVYRDSYLSRRGLVHRIDRRAAELGAMGIARGDRVGLMLGNVPDFVVLALAISKLGGVVVPIDPTTGTRELNMILSLLGLRGLITRPRGGETVAIEAAAAAARSAARRAPAHKPDTPEARRRLQGTLLTCNIYPPRAPGGAREEPVAVLITADSAGDPKAVARGEDEVAAACADLGAALKVSARDHVLAATPLYHAYGFDFAFAPALRYGTGLHLEDEFSLRRILKALREGGVTFLPGSPDLYETLAREPTGRPLRERARARFLSAGAPLDAAIHETFHKRYGVRVLSCYHTSEAGPVAVDLTGRHPGGVGKVLRGVQVRLGASPGAPGRAPRNGDGAGEAAIWVRSRITAAAAGRRGRVAGPRAVMPVGETDADGWLRTGDLGMLDRAGRLHVIGREDDLVKIEGKRVALNEIEACIEELPHVARAQAQVVNDPVAGQQVIARVVARSHVPADQIIDYCARNLAPYKVPRRIEFCRELS